MELAVVAVDEEKAAAVQASGNASISAGIVIASFDADSLAGNPGGVLGEVGKVAGCWLLVVGCDAENLGIERDEDSGSQRLAAEALRAVVDGTSYHA